MEFYQWQVEDNMLCIKILGTDHETIKKTLVKELNLRKIKITTIMFDEIFKNPDNYTKISELKGIDLDGKCAVELSKDLLTARITLFPPINGGNKLASIDVKKLLLEKSVKFGINDVKIMIALTKDAIVEEEIASGKPSQPGKKAEINYYFNLKGLDLKLKELENGSVDFYNLSLIQNVKKDQLLFEKTPATKGIAGMTVTGIELPGVDGKDIPMPVGKNIVLVEELKAYPECEGHIVVTNGKVSVLPVYEILGDVDFSTGNIDYCGNVIVRGDIKNNFSIKANGDVELYGSIEGGHVSAEGNINVRKGIRGLKKSNVTAKGSIYADFIEHANIFAGNDVIVNEAIMHSHVESQNRIQVSGRKGLIVGGTCRAGKGIECKNIGSNLATLTKIEVGINPKLRIEYNDVSREQVVTKDSLDKTVKTIKLLKDLKEKLQKLPADKESLLLRLFGTRDDLIKQEEVLTNRKKELEEEIKNLEAGSLKVQNTLNCGVIIEMGKASKHITIENYKVKLVQDGMDIKILPLVD